jgi:prepilin-type processing-associated H-X9-DG protein
MTSVDDPTRTILVYEGKGGQLSFRHNGKAAVAFVDGHAQLVTPEEAKKLIWKP